MFDIGFEFNDKKVRPNDLGKAFVSAVEAQVLRSVQETVKRAAAGSRCPVHGQALSIVVKGNDLKHLSFDVEGCCQDLICQVT